MPFQDPIVDDLTLVREAIESENYVANTSGWRISRDGDAEFSNALLRGNLEVGPPSPAPRIAIVSSSQIPATLASASADFTWTAADVKWFNGTDYSFEAIGYYNIPGPLATQIYAQGTYDTTNLLHLNIVETVPAGAPPIEYFGSDVYNSVSSRWIYRNGSLELTATMTMLVPTGYQLGWGIVGMGVRTAGFTATVAGATPSAEVAVAAAAWDVEPQAVCVPGRMYRFRGSAQHAVGGVIGATRGTIRIRVGSASVAGTVVATNYVSADTNAWEPTYPIEGYAAFAGGASATKTFSLTVQKNVGAAGSTLLVDSDAASPMRVEIKDVGAAAEARFNGITATFT